MIKEVNYNYKGKDFKINMFSNKDISNFDIPLPAKYKIISRGLETYYYNGISQDIDKFAVENCSGLICIVNLDHEILDEKINEDIDDLDHHMYLVSKCSMVYITVNNGKIICADYYYNTSN